MNQNIANVAQAYNGEKEVPGNMGFTDHAFEKKMVDVELCVKEGNPAFYGKYEKLFSASATTSFKNFDQAHLTSQIPEVGDGVIWRHGMGWEGHAGIVIAVDIVNNTIHTIEGNTNTDGGREGIEVAAKVRKIKDVYKPQGLNLVGFIKFNV
jgi:hypothetical protein